jgi:hypothetical protein
MILFFTYKLGSGFHWQGALSSQAAIARLRIASIFFYLPVIEQPEVPV